MLALESETRTMIFYESPHRISKTLQQFTEVFGPDREAVVAREITKLHEETIRGTLATLVAHFETHPPKGEMVVVLQGNSK